MRKDVDHFPKRDRTDRYVQYSNFAWYIGKLKAKQQFPSENICFKNLCENLFKVMYTTLVETQLLFILKLKVDNISNFVEECSTYIPFYLYF